MSRELNYARTDAVFRHSADGVPTKTGTSVPLYHRRAAPSTSTSSTAPGPLAVVRGRRPLSAAVLVGTGWGARPQTIIHTARYFRRPPPRRQRAYNRRLASS